jgi:hypothetical protein
MSCVEGTTPDLNSLGFEEELEPEEETAELEECSDDEEEWGERESVAEGGLQNAEDDNPRMNQTNGRPKRKTRDKALMAVMSFSIIMAARSQRINSVTVCFNKNRSYVHTN